MRKISAVSRLAAACMSFCLISAPVLAQVPGLDAVVTGDDAYVLGSGDKVKITVYGEDDLSGEFGVDGGGNVSLPMIGQVHVAGLTPLQFSSTVAQALLDRHYLVRPRVSSEVSNYRPFAILGEVNHPGQYPYENAMSVLNAVALAGGFTYRADQRNVYILRKGATQEMKLPADDRTRVSPGDTVRVDERIF